MDIILGLLNKTNKHSETKTEKYEILDCQKSFDKTIDTRKIINLKDIVKSSNNLKIFNASFFNSDIIIKIGLSETIEREYKISHALYNQKNILNLTDKHKYLHEYKYFIKYFCYFSCKNNLYNIIENSSVCSNDGDNLKILIMKKYKFGSIKNYNWSFDNFNILKELIKQIFYALLSAYKNYGFIHNDCHFGNFLIGDHYQVIIIDFENSLFDLSKKDNIKFLYQSFEQIINNILYELNINTTNINNILHYLKENNNIVIDINILLNYVDDINFISINDKSVLQKYDPNIF